MEKLAGIVAMVVKSKSCIICLHPNHGVGKLYDNDNAMRICSFTVVPAITNLP